MTYSFGSFIDALMDDITTNVSWLRDAHQHRYASWDPADLIAQPGERHIAVWLDSDTPEQALPLVTGPGGDLLLDTYQVAYWENAGDEASRAIANEEAASRMLGLIESVRGRLYVQANLTLGGAEHIRYLGAVIPARSASVRWFQIALTARSSIVVS